MLFRLSEVRFAPTLVPTLAALSALCLLLYLGHWQQGRAAEKRDLQTQFENRVAAMPVVLGGEISDPLALRYSRASARGEWSADEQFFIDNKFDHDAVGYHVIAPLKIAGTNRYLLINRGWVARAASYPTPPSIPVPSGLVNVDGVVTLPSTRFLELNAATTQGNVWQNLTTERYRAASGRDVLPLVLLANTATSPLKPVTEQPNARAEKHIEYMLTWYSLAATVVALWVGLNLQRERALKHAPPINEGTNR